jgi:hypothetical protein
VFFFNAQGILIRKMGHRNSLEDQRWPSEWGTAIEPESFYLGHISKTPQVDVESTRHQLKQIMITLSEIPVPLRLLINEYAADVFYMRYLERCGGEWLTWFTPNTFGSIDFDRKLFMVYFLEKSLTPQKALTLRNGRRYDYDFTNYNLDVKQIFRKVACAETLEQTLDALAKHDRANTKNIETETKAIAFEFENKFQPEHDRKLLERKKSKAQWESDPGLSPELRRLAEKGERADAIEMDTQLRYERILAVDTNYNLRSFVFEFAP